MNISYYKSCFNSGITMGDISHEERPDQNLNIEEKNQRKEFFLNVFNTILKYIKNDKEKMNHTIKYTTMHYVYEDTTFGNYEVQLVKEDLLVDGIESEDDYRMTIDTKINGDINLKLTSEESEEFMLALYETKDEDDQVSIIIAMIETNGVRTYSHDCDQCGDYNYEYFIG